MRAKGFTLLVTLLLLQNFSSANDGPMPLGKERAAVYEYYKLGWLPDGYPGKKTEKGIVAHPIYGPYVINDYLLNYSRTKDVRYLRAAESVADSGIARMSDFKGALVFFYHQDDGLSSLPGTFYSALTQARWIDSLMSLHKANKNDKYVAINKRIAKSFSIPVSEGGVLQPVAGGVAIEEYPHEVPLLTLNGWLSSLNILITYANAENDSDARSLANQNIKALEALLPLYDVPELFNSRYQLTNVAKFRFSGAKVIDAKIEIPGVGTHGLGDPTKTGKLWTNYIQQVKKSQIMNAVLSYETAPKANTLHIETEEDGVVKIEIGASDYNPTTTSLPTTRWEVVGTLDTHKRTASIEIPWNKAYLVAYPTAFTKKIGAKKQNVYHLIHVKELEKLYRNTGNEVFLTYSKKWSSYFKHWKELPQYQNPDISLEIYNQ
jgi:hypothetical protein